MSSQQNEGLHADPESAHQRPQNNDVTSSKTTLVRSVGVVVSLVAVVICSYLLFNLFKGTLEVPALDSAEQQTITEQTAPPIDTIEQSQVQTTQPTSPANNKPAPPPLPNLNDSDIEIQQAASKLSQSLKWADWITTEEAIRKFVVVIDNMAQGKIAKKYLPIPKPEHKFTHSEAGIKVFLDPAGFKRYTSYISLFESIDNDMAVELYQRYSPLMEQAFSELGYPDRNFHDTLMQAFDVLLNAPVMEEQIELVRPNVLYKFAYPSLESAPAVHKQLIRMGPENTRRLQQKAQQFKTALSAIKQP